MIRPVVSYHFPERQRHDRFYMVDKRCLIFGRMSANFLCTVAFRITGAAIGIIATIAATVTVAANVTRVQTIIR